MWICRGFCIFTQSVFSFFPPLWSNFKWSANTHSSASFVQLLISESLKNLIATCGLYPQRCTIAHGYTLMFRIFWTWHQRSLKESRAVLPVRLFSCPHVKYETYELAVNIFVRIHKCKYPILHASSVSFHRPLQSQTLRKTVKPV